MSSERAPGMPSRRNSPQWENKTHHWMEGHVSSMSLPGGVGGREIGCGRAGLVKRVGGNRAALVKRLGENRAGLVKRVGENRAGLVKRLGENRAAFKWGRRMLLLGLG